MCSCCGNGALSDVRRHDRDVLLVRPGRAQSGPQIITHRQDSRCARETEGGREPDVFLRWWGRARACWGLVCLGVSLSLLFHTLVCDRSHYLLVLPHPSCLFIALLGGAHTGEHVFWIGSAAHKDVDSEANRHPRCRGASGRANLPSLTALGTLPISIIRNSPAATDAGGQQRQRRRRRKRGRPRW